MTSLLIVKIELFLILTVPSDNDQESNLLRFLAPEMFFVGLPEMTSYSMAYMFIVI